ncbi:MAG: DegT/DnrJ/EryC1/StrS family aminotransferase [bacterium]
MAVKPEKKAERGRLAIHGGKPIQKKPPQQKVLIEDKDIKAVVKVMESGFLTALSNPVVGEFERKFAEYCGVKYGIAVNSGTAALHVALAALDVGPGDEVIVPPYTFIATASAVLQQNAVPVFADVDPTTLNIDPAEIEKKITRRTKAIIPVHIFGLPADMKEINKIAKKRGIPVIEDACQAHGATIKGKRVGGFGKMACFSFQESKNLTTGEGGMIVTDDKKLAEKCRIIKHIGMAARYEYVTLGYNYRLPAMSAALGLAHLKKLDAFNDHRRNMAEYYSDNLNDLPLELVNEPTGFRSAHHLFPIKLAPHLTDSLEKSYEIYCALAAENVPIWWVYPRPLYQIEFLQERKAYTKECPFVCKNRNKPHSYKKVKCPVTEDVTMRTFVLITAPCYGESVARDTVRALKKVLPHFE